MGLSITQCREQGSREPWEAEPSWPGGSGFPQKSRSGLVAALMGMGISRRKQIPTAIKKGDFLQWRPAWRGERALCCNHGEG